MVGVGGGWYIMTLTTKEGFFKAYSSLSKGSHRKIDTLSNSNSEQGREEGKWPELNALAGELALSEVLLICRWVHIPECF